MVPPAIRSAIQRARWRTKSSGALRAPWFASGMVQGMIGTASGRGASGQTVTEPA